MAKYRVTLDQKRFETAQIEIEAESKEDAEDKALAKAGDLSWTQDQVDEGSTFVSEVEQL